MHGETLGKLDCRVVLLFFFFERLSALEDVFMTRILKPFRDLASEN